MMNLANIFSVDLSIRTSYGQSVRRQGTNDGAEIVLDCFGAEAACAFIRLEEGQALRIALNGRYALDLAAGGGWLLAPSAGSGDAYWIPVMPVLRRSDEHGRILDERPTRVAALAVSDQSAEIGFAAVPGFRLDCVAWRLPASHPAIAHIMRPSAYELQPIFSWGSHTPYAGPASVYTHLIFGRMYENRYAWPHKRKICSENDAHAFHVTLSGLARRTGSPLFAWLKSQLVLSVLARQDADGGLRHGEWTDDMEAHYRLASSALHLLMDAFTESADASLREPMARLAAFLADARDETAIGTWFMHDELEKSEAGMAKYPFLWIPSRAFGKRPTNMLVLNTHLDLTLGLDRYGRLTGDERFASMVASAHRAALTVLGARPMEWLYHLYFKPIYLSLYPTAKAAALPLPLRALKRIGWKCLVPNLYRLKTRFPRLVMPGGYIDRATSLGSWSFHYLTINLMDLLRFHRRFPDAGVVEIIRMGIAFVQNSGIREHWAELHYERYALGFWAEALYQACLLFPDVNYRTYLAEAILQLDRLGMGMPPSLLGANPELDTPQPPVDAAALHAGLRVVALGGPGGQQQLLVNTGRAVVDFTPAGASAALRLSAGEWKLLDGQAPVQGGTSHG